MSDKITVKANESFTCWTGTEMVVLNVGETGELPARQAQDYIEAGLATKIGGKGKGKGKADAESEPASAASEEAPV